MDTNGGGKANKIAVVSAWISPIYSPSFCRSFLIAHYTCCVSAQPNGQTGIPTVRQESRTGNGCRSTQCKQQKRSARLWCSLCSAGPRPPPAPITGPTGAGRRRTALPVAAATQRLGRRQKTCSGRSSCPVWAQAHRRCGATRWLSPARSMEKMPPFAWIATARNCGGARSMPKKLASTRRRPVRIPHR